MSKRKNYLSGKKREGLWANKTIDIFFRKKNKESLGKVKSSGH